MAAAKTYLEGAKVAAEVFQLRPDYRALLMVVKNIPPGPCDDNSEEILTDAEKIVQENLKAQPVTSNPHVLAWREAFKAFGAKPAKTRSSLEALLRRAEKGLPRINRLTDIYNAISIKHQIPFGGEDLDTYNGPPFLIRATGEEKFELMSNGESVNEPPEVGEVVWCDGDGVTCRRWNWRQCKKTALTDTTTNVLFILDALNPITDEALIAAGKELEEELGKLSPDVEVSSRLIKA